LKTSVKYYLLLLLSLSFLLSNAQKWNLQYHFYPNKIEKKINSLFSQTIFKDSTQIVKYLKQKKIIAIKNGYLALSIDSIKFSPSKIASAYISINQKYQYLQISFDEKNNDILRKSNTTYLKNYHKNIYNITKQNKKISDYLANNAYPFAQVYLDSLFFNNDTIKASLKIEKREYIVFDSLIIEGTLKINYNFIQRYTSWNTGEKFKRDVLLFFQKKINELPFAQMKEAPKLSIKNGKATLYVKIDKKNSNRLDGILGILPDNKITSKIMLTGELNIALQNIAKQGETFDFNWKKQEAFSQELQINARIPYLFNTNLGLSSGIQLHKKDTSYINTKWYNAILFYFSKQNYLGFNLSHQSSSLLTKDSLLIENMQNYNSFFYGLSFKYTQLNNIFNPYRGLDIQIQGDIGKRKLQEENKQTNPLQYKFFCNIRFFIPLWGKSTFLIANKSGSIYASPIFVNEMYRIGGLKTIRGFMEASINASSYSIFSLEYRFLFEKESAFFLFFDEAWYEKNIKPYYKDYLSAFGLGLFFHTKAGIFSLSYALGKEKNSYFQIKNAKIHFGYISKF